MRALLLTAVTTFGLDQLTKWFVVQWLDLLSRGEIDVFPPLINFRMAWNQGVNFGLFSNSTDIVRWVLIAVALVISGWVILWVQREKMRRLAQVSAGLLVGGALGNVVDRLAYGAVADFLNMSCCGIENPYSFNVADIAVFAGAFGLVLFAGGKSKGAGQTKPVTKRRKTP
jgi:signal peptidase II